MSRKEFEAVAARVERLEAWCERLAAWIEAQDALSRVTRPPLLGPGGRRRPRAGDGPSARDGGRPS